jgi:hypothetical protein
MVVQAIGQGDRLGHLMIPYTNPTWWCDGPKGPTFEQHGDAPLLRGLDGKLAHERYSQNEGFTVCHWHPAMRAANQKTVEQFSRDYPCDILFQDQCSVRGWRYDTNPASPTVWAYTEGSAASARLLPQRYDQGPAVAAAELAAWLRFPAISRVEFAERARQAANQRSRNTL